MAHGENEITPERVFSLSEANHLIPQLQNHLSTVQEGKEVLVRTREEVSRASANAAFGGGTAVGRPYVKSLLDISTHLQAIHELGVVVEMASFQDVLFLLTPHDNRSSVAIALDALEKVTTLASFKRPSRFAQLPPLPMVQPERALEPFEVFPKRAQTTMVPWRKAVGRIAANTCGAYPPGYPLIVAGERWPVETLEYLRGVVREGGQLKGNFADPELESIRVVVES